MPTGPRGQKRPTDVIGSAIKVARIANREEEEDVPAKPEKDQAAAMGRKGGAARAANLTLEKRTAIARKAAAKPGQCGPYRGHRTAER